MRGSYGERLLTRTRRSQHCLLWGLAVEWHVPELRRCNAERAWAVGEGATTVARDDVFAGTWGGRQTAGLRSLRVDAWGNRARGAGRACQRSHCAQAGGTVSPPRAPPA